jgi:hypothetical protein
MYRQTAMVLSILLAVPAVGWAGGRRYQPPADPAATAGASPSPELPREKPIEKLEQRILTLGEMVEYFTNLKEGTALRLTYANGSEYAGNFVGREPGRALIYCRNGLAGQRQVPLRKVMDAYVIVSSSLTVRIHQKDFPWRDR